MEWWSAVLPLMQAHGFRSASHRIAAESRSTLEPSPKRLDDLASCSRQRRVKLVQQCTASRACTSVLLDRGVRATRSQRAEDTIRSDNALCSVFRSPREALRVTHGRFQGCVERDATFMRSAASCVSALHDRLSIGVDGMLTLPPPRFRCGRFSVWSAIHDAAKVSASACALDRQQFLCGDFSSLPTCVAYHWIPFARHVSSSLETGSWDVEEEVNRGSGSLPLLYAVVDTSYLHSSSAPCKHQSYKVPARMPQIGQPGPCTLGPLNHNPC